ncbi:hypothetical protein QBC38DRAFT_485627 [Podospora fimiseda]|uniref:Uncharacterized protein n=1 Tax=Podospora fimiseda TaxID=252190 RepID=A0AAN7BJI3_9PEZI|nr:hypothetical protein QBC38DRAFT_485627 [Podospora fimiseda]
MLLLTALTTAAVLFQGHALAQEVALDWSKAPGGAPWSYMRTCTKWVFVSDRDSVQIYLGCSVNSCICRSDLIKKAQAYITDKITTDCGGSNFDPTIDVEQALKVYNDYCSANGYNVPNWTYIRTQTVRVTTTPSSTLRPTDGSAPAVITSGPQNGGSGGGGYGNQPAVVTVTRPAASSGSRRTQIPWIWVSVRLSCRSILRVGSLLSTMPKRLMSVLGDTAVVVVTQTPPPPGFTSMLIKSIVETPGFTSTFIKSVIQTQGVPISTLIKSVIETQGVPISTSIVTQVVGGFEGNSGADPNEDVKSGSGGKDEKSLTKLEVVGIVLGIVFGLITTVAAVCGCVWQGARQRLG